MEQRKHELVENVATHVATHVAMQQLIVATNVATHMHMFIQINTVQTLKH